MFSFDAAAKRFVGVKGFSFVRVTPRLEGGWAELPFYFKRYERERSQGSPHPTVMFLTSKNNGPNVDDTFVLMRLEPYSEMLKTLVESDPARYLGDN